MLYVCVDRAIATFGSEAQGLRHRQPFGLVVRERHVMVRGLGFAEDPRARQSVKAGIVVPEAEPVLRIADREDESVGAFIPCPAIARSSNWVVWP